MSFNYKIKAFNDLSLRELYDILKLRNAVFIVEQNCPYQDIDDKDEDAQHMIIYERQELIGYLRILTIPYPAIGRVIVHPSHRKRRLAETMMKEAMEYLTRKLKKGSIKLQAQTYLLGFYEKLGFKPVSEEYLEDGIPHVDMVYSN